MSRTPESDLRRLNACALLAFLPVLPIVGRLAYLHVVQGDRLRGMATKELTRVEKEPILRGRILDARGRVLAESVPAWSVYADPSVVKDPWRAAARLAPVLGAPEQELRTRLRSNGRFVWLKRHEGIDVAQAVQKLGIAGLGLLLDEDRRYPNGSLARNLLGQVGNDGNGLSGLELVYQRDLDGENRRMKLLIDGAGATVEREAQGAFRPPGDLRLTLDASIQYFAEEALRSALSRFKAKGGMAVVQDPRTGEILAMASLPTSPLSNPPAQEVFEPGSTIKFLAAAAAIEEKAVRPDEKIDCEFGTWKPFPGVAVHDHEEYGLLDLAGILRNSSNIGIAKVAQRLGADRFHRYASMFGLGLQTGLGLPGEPNGYVPDPARMRPVNLVTASYGYGINLTAIQLVTAYSSLANGGYLMQPRVVRGVSASGSQPPDQTPIRVRRTVSESTILSVRAMLEGVVREGTGQKAGVRGYEVAGKTGTSKRRDPETGRYEGAGYMASFCGFVPSGNPRFTILVVMDQPLGAYYAAEVAAPVFSEIAGQILAYEGTPRDVPLPTGPAPWAAPGGFARQSGQEPAATAAR